MTISLIAALAENRVIGAGGRLPWRLPDDLIQFKKLTWGHSLILGRKTYESIGRPLPGRRIIVLSRRASLGVPDEIEHAASLDEALERCRDAAEAFVGGGSEVYRCALPRADRLYLTRVRARVEGDRCFPEVDWSQWRLIGEKEHSADERHAFAFTFQTWQRR